jgi:hypothetical protein
MTQALAENIKRLREIYKSPFAIDEDGMLPVISELVQLVGEMSHTMETANDIGCLKYLNACDDAGAFWHETVTKAAPIAALVKGGVI